MVMKPFALITLALLVTFLAAPQVQAETPDAEALMKTAHLNMYYAGDDGSSRVQMTITDKRGKTREREFVIVRKDFEEGGEQRYYVYFFTPNDVRRTTFMAWKDPADDDSRWIYIPSLDLVKPISANDKKSSFVGSDFSYEDVSGRHWSDDTHTFVREEEMGGFQTVVIESVPKKKDYFQRKTSWIDKESMLVVREEYFGKKDEPERIFEVLKIETVDGYATAIERKMTTTRKNNVTSIVFQDVAFDQGVEKEIFSERYLKSPPKNYIQ